MSKKFFSKNPAATHNFISLSNTMSKIRKKKKQSYSQKISTQKDKRMDGRMDRPYSKNICATLGFQKQQKNINDMVQASLFLTLIRFHTFSSVSIINFELINVCWVVIETHSLHENCDPVFLNLVQINPTYQEIKNLT